MATYYEVLGVPAGATQDEIRRAYHRQARIHHPDTRAGGTGGTSAGARRMVSINAAWEVLSDPGRRRSYDAELGHRSPPAPRRPDGGGPGAEPDFPDWFEPDDVAAADLDEEDGASGYRDPADLIVFLPVGLVALAVSLFAFSMVSQSSVLFTLALVLVPVAVAAFFAMPLVMMLSRVRSRENPRD